MVQIKYNMLMPEACVDCDFEKYGFTGKMCCMLLCQETTGADFDRLADRLPDCPLEEVEE